MAHGGKLAVDPVGYANKGQMDAPWGTFDAFSWLVAVSADLRPRRPSRGAEWKLSSLSDGRHSTFRELDSVNLPMRCAFTIRSACSTTYSQRVSAMTVCIFSTRAGG